MQTAVVMPMSMAERACPTSLSKKAQSGFMEGADVDSATARLVEDLWARAFPSKRKLFFPKPPRQELEGLNIAEPQEFSKMVNEPPSTVAAAAGDFIRSSFIDTRTAHIAEDLWDSGIPSWKGNDTAPKKLQTCAPPPVRNFTAGGAAAELQGGNGWERGLAPRHEYLEGLAVRLAVSRGAIENLGMLRHV